MYLPTETAPRFIHFAALMNFFCNIKAARIQYHPDSVVIPARGHGQAMSIIRVRRVILRREISKLISYMLL